MKMNIYTLSYEIYVFIISHHTKAVKQILPTFYGTWRKPCMYAKSYVSRRTNINTRRQQDIYNIGLTYL